MFKQLKQFTKTEQTIVIASTILILTAIIVQLFLFAVE
jgi:hypothetical protein